MQCGLQDSADLTVFNLLDIMMFFYLTVHHWVVFTLVLLLHVCTLILIDIDIDIVCKVFRVLAYSCCSCS